MDNHLAVEATTSNMSRNSGYSASFVPRNSIPTAPHGRLGNRWMQWLTQCQETGDAICLLPIDSRQAHSMRNTAHNAAKRKGIAIRTRLITDGEKLKLYIWVGRLVTPE